jgi:hypothetical protein
MKIKELLSEEKAKKSGGARKRIETQYKFGAPNAKGAVEFQVKSGEDFPYRLTPIDGKFRLQQSFSERSYMKPTFKKIKDFDTEDAAYEYVIARHNKDAAGHMSKHWKTIA